jgi:hypothetical protein
MGILVGVRLLLFLLPCIRTRGVCPTVPKHDRVTHLLDGDEAGPPILGMSVRSFPSFSEDFAWEAVKRIFRYLGHTPDFVLWYSASSSLALHGFSDADFAGCRLDRSPLLGLANFWDLLWCLGLPATSRVLLNPLPRQSTLPQLVVTLSSFGSHTP